MQFLLLKSYFILKSKLLIYFFISCSQWFKFVWHYKYIQSNFQCKGANRALEVTNDSKYVFAGSLDGVI